MRSDRPGLNVVAKEDRRDAHTALRVRAAPITVTQSDRLCGLRCSFEVAVAGRAEHRVGYVRPLGETSDAEQGDD